MTAAAFRRESRAPALLAAFALHVGLFLAVLWFSRPASLPMGTAVPINIVASGPTTNSRPAEQAPIAQDAQTPTPVPEAKAPSPPPPPPPTPRPVVKTEPVRPQPTPRPVVKTEPVRSRPAPTPRPSPKAAPTPPQPSPRRDTFSLDALQASISKATRHAPAAPAMARRGPARAETALTARVDAGTGVSQSDIAGLSQLLERLWNPDCGVEERVIIPVRFTIGYDGHLQGRVNAEGRENASDPVVQVAARRAIDAVHEAAPYAPTYRGLTITVRFDAAKACADK